MASWKKIITSGSKAELNEITASTMTVKTLVVTGSGTITADSFQTTEKGTGVAVTAGGTGLKSIAANSILVANSSNTLTALNSGSLPVRSLSFDGIKFGEGILTSSDASSSRAHIGLGDIATQSTTSLALTGTSNISSSGQIKTSGTVLLNGTNALANNQITASISGSFTGDGSNLTGIVTTLGITGDSGTDTVDMQNQNLSFTGSDGITTSVADDGVTITIDADQDSHISSILTTDLKIGEDTQTKIDFETPNEIHLDADNVQRMNVTAEGINVTGSITNNSSISSSGKISAGGGIFVAGTERTVGDTSYGLFVEQAVSASGFAGNFLEVTNSVIITSASTEFGDALSDTHIFSGSLNLTSSNDVVLDSPRVIGGVNTTFSASIVDGLTGNFDTVDIDGGAIDGVTIGTTNAVTDLRVDNLKLDGSTISSTNTNGNITVSPNGTGNTTFTGDVVLPSVNIASGSIDGGSAGALRIGAEDSSGVYTEGAAHVEVTGSFTGSFRGDGSNLTGIVTTLNIAGDGGSDSDGVDLKTQSLTFEGGEGIDTEIADNKVIIKGEDASSSNKGIASFGTIFTVNSGVVTMSSNVINNDLLTNDRITISDGSSNDAVELGETLTIQGTADEIETSISSNVLTVGLPNNVTIGNDLSVTNDLTITNDLTVNGNVTLGNATSDTVTIAGDLIVGGTTTAIETQDLKVEDNIIYLGSGSYLNNNTVDSGIVFERGQTAPNQYASLFFDESANRFALTPGSGSGGLTDDGLSGETNFASTAQSQFIMTVSSSTVSPSAAPNETLNGSDFGNSSDAETQVGQVRIQTGDDANGVAGDIWIYS